MFLLRGITSWVDRRTPPSLVFAMADMPAVRSAAENPYRNVPFSYRMTGIPSIQIHSVPFLSTARDRTWVMGLMPGSLTLTGLKVCPSKRNSASSVPTQRLNSDQGLTGIVTAIAQTPDGYAREPSAACAVPPVHHIATATRRRNTDGIPTHRVHGRYWNFSMTTSASCCSETFGNSMAAG